MTDCYDLNLYAKVAGIRLVVLANRLGCSNEGARKAHNKLEVRLAEFIADLGQLLATERRQVLNTDPTKAEDLDEEVWGGRWDLRDYWVGDPIPLLDYLWVDRGTDEYFHPHDERWYFLGDDYPLTVDLTDEELCGLGPILRQIYGETGARFTAYRVIFEGDVADAARAEDRHGPLDSEAHDDLALAGPDND